MEVEIISLVQNIGFPIAITVWFMIRTEKVIDRNTAAFERMSTGCPAMIDKKKE